MIRAHSPDPFGRPPRSASLAARLVSRLLRGFLLASVLVLPPAAAADTAAGLGAAQPAAGLTPATAGVADAARSPSTATAPHSAPASVGGATAAVRGATASVGGATAAVGGATAAAGRPLPAARLVAVELPPRLLAQPSGAPAVRGAVVAASAARLRSSPALRLSRPVDPSAQPDRGWRWPLAGRPEVTRAFDLPGTPYGSGHRGVDLAAVPGARVLAAGPGVVGWAGVLAGRGVVSLRHPGGLRTTYEPVTATVRAGQPVGAGEVLGLLAAGHTGCPRPACLHWGLLRGDSYLDPLALLGRGPVRLLPLARSSPARAEYGDPGAGGRPAETASADGRPERHPLVSPSTTAATLGLAVAWAVIMSRRRPP